VLISCAGRTAASLGLPEPKCFPNNCPTPVVHDHRKGRIYGEPDWVDSSNRRQVGEFFGRYPLSNAEGGLESLMEFRPKEELRNQGALTSFHFPAAGPNVDFPFLVRSPMCQGRREYTRGLRRRSRAL
jgi:hypothetical protein